MDFQRVAKAVVPWLEYQTVCGREMLLSESYLAQPIGELLRLEHGGEVKAEFNHPTITAPARGRRRQVDYALLGKVEKKLVAALEVKWADETAMGKQRLLDDLLRLECLKDSPESDQSVERFFLIAGKTAHIQSSLIDLQSNTGAGRTPFLPWLLKDGSDEWHAVDVENAPDYMRKYFKSFEESYRVDSPKRFRTRRVVSVEHGTFRALLWEVDSGAGRRATFKAATKWAEVDVPETESDD